MLFHPKPSETRRFPPPFPRIPHIREMRLFLFLFFFIHIVKVAKNVASNMHFQLEHLRRGVENSVTFGLDNRRVSAGSGI